MKSKIAIKSIILAVLILLCILQIEKLWFENGSSHSFFRYTPQKSKSEIALWELILEPDYLAIYQGEKRGEYYQPDTDGILFNSILKDGNKLIRRLPQMTTTRYSYAQIFEKPHILCRFRLPIRSEVIEQVAGVKNEKESFPVKSMVIVPAGLEESRFSLLFYSADTERVLAYSIDKDELQEENEVFSQYIANKTIEGEKILLSAKQQKLPGFVGEVLLPDQRQNYILPLEHRMEKIFLSDSGIDTDRLSEYLFSFVKNPKILWNIIEPDRVRYGDSSVLMEYTTEGIFTYQFIPTEEIRKSAQDLVAGEALKKAIAFLEKDGLLRNQEFRLSGYRQEEGKHYFSFAYYYRGHPMIWKGKADKSAGVNYPMQVVVEKDYVTQYRRLVLQSDSLLEQGSRFRVNYEKALNEYYQKQGRDKIQELYLGYVTDEDRMELSWVLETAMERFIYPLNTEAGANELE